MRNKYLKILLLLFLGLPLSGLSLDSINYHLYHHASELEYTGDLEKLVNELSEEANSDFERAELISYWITTHIRYDVESVTDGSFATKKTDILLERKGVCSDYAHLFKRMCDLAGIECYEVIGYGKTLDDPPGFIYDLPNHAWNVVLIDSLYYFVDATWGAGHRRHGTKIFISKFNEKQILVKSTDAAEFREKHLPADPRWQLSEKIVSLNSFVVNEHYEHMIHQEAPYFSFPDSINLYREMNHHDKEIAGALNTFQFNPTINNRKTLGETYAREGYALAMGDFSMSNMKLAIAYYDQALQNYTHLIDSEDREERVKRAISGKKYAKYRLRFKK